MSEFEPNPFKRDERAEMKSFWIGAAATGALFLACVIAAVLWGQS
ncbi:MAG TPA: hypothetical protein VGK73_31700 [Polyangiaceae bacterium]